MVKKLLYYDIKEKSFKRIIEKKRYLGVKINIVKAKCQMKTKKLILL